MSEGILQDRERVLELLESYESLLTDKQREVVNSHYRYDLSISEIAEEEGITRAGVNDSLQKALSKLEEYEDKLHLIEKKKTWIKEKDKIEALPIESKAKAYEKLMEEIVHGI